MGIKLSSQGILTYSQKVGLSKEDQTKLYEKLRKLPINQPILKHLADVQKAKTEKARERAQGKSSTTSKPEKSSKDD